MNTAENVTELIGNTPLLRLSHFDEEYSFEIWGKCEFMNPSGSIKDRMAISMIKEAEKEGNLKPNMEILVPTTGNTGISFACLGGYLGYKVTIVMPEEMSYERKLLDKLFGAKLIYTPGGESDAMDALNYCKKMAREHPQEYWVANQWESEANVKAHFETTGKELITQLGNDIGLLVAGIGTGGTLIGIAKRLKEVDPNTQVVGMEPAECPTATKWYRGEKKTVGRHEIEGIGDGFVPGLVQRHRELIDGFVLVSSDEAIHMAEKLARDAGLGVGISSGANVVAAVRAAKRLNIKQGKVVTVFPDYAARYFSTRLFLKRKLRQKEHEKHLKLSKW